MGWMKSVKDARVSEGGIYVAPGAYVVEINKVKAGQTRAKVENFIVELIVRESTNPQRPVGTIMDWYVDMSKEPSPGNVLAFMMTATGASREEVTEEAIQLVCSEANPLRGTILRLAAANIKTKAGRDFTKVKFFAADADAADVATEAAKVE